MRKFDELLTFYSQVLDAVDLKVDEDGAITFEPPGAVDKNGEPMVMPAVLEGKRWVLPTKAILDESPWDTKIAFHPLSENILNGESAVVGKLKAAINVKLGAVIGELLGQLTNFAAHPESQGTVSAKASKYLKLVPDLKSISAERMVQIVERSGLSADRRFVNVYLKKGGKVLDHKYQCAAIVRFPFREELEGKDPKAFGVTLSKKDQASFKALFDYLLPDNDEVATYSVGSSSNSASKFDALLKAFAKVATQLNEISALHKKILPTYKDLTINLDWVETLPLLDKLADVIPPLPGNIGESAREPRTEGAAGQAIAPKAKRMFEQQLPAKANESVRVSADVTAQPTAVVAEPEPDDSQLTFSERIAKQRQRAQQAANTGYGRQPAAPTRGYGARQYQPADAGVPGWAANQSTTIVVAGQDPNDKRYESREHNRWGSQVNRQDVRPFSERMAGIRPQETFRGSSNRGGNFQV